jgi:hypothetical protein
VLLALKSSALSEDALLLCDNEAVLRVIKKLDGWNTEEKQRQPQRQMLTSYAR